MITNTPGMPSACRHVVVALLIVGVSPSLANETSSSSDPAPAKPIVAAVGGSLVAAEAIVVPPAVVEAGTATSERAPVPPLLSSGPQYAIEAQFKPFLAPVEGPALATQDRLTIPGETARIIYFQRTDGSVTFDLRESGVRGMNIANVSASDPRAEAFNRVGGVKGIFVDRDKRKSRNLELAFHALNAVDAVETLVFLKRGVREANPIYGPNPSALKLLTGKALGSIAYHFAINGLMRTDPKLARGAQYVTLGLMGGVVAWNLQAVF